jgi:hypothetical protein
MAHYSMPSGITDSIEPGILSQPTFEALLPTIAGGQHALPIRGYQLGVGLFRHRAGWLCGAHVIVLGGTRLVATFTVALTPDDAEALWKPFESFICASPIRTHLIARIGAGPRCPMCRYGSPHFPFIAIA